MGLCPTVCFVIEFEKKTLENICVSTMPGHVNNNVTTGLIYVNEIINMGTAVPLTSTLSL